jgi:uncharacterized membrane protein
VRLLHGIHQGSIGSPPKIVGIMFMNDNRRISSGANPSATAQESELADVVHRNIDALLEVRQKFERGKSRQDRVADAITSFTGSMPFLYIHAALVILWLAVNMGLIPGLKPFDPFPFVMLAMIASVEAIFLSTFVLISQNRAAALAEKRAELDLQINLLTEHEVTRLIELVDLMTRHFGIGEEKKPDVEQLKKDVAPEVVLQEIEEAQKSGDTQSSIG